MDSHGSFHADHLCDQLPRHLLRRADAALAFAMKLPKQVREHIAMAIQELDDAGIAWEIEAGSRHYRLMYEVEGKPVMMIVSGSPSDRRSRMNLRSQVKSSIKKDKQDV